MVHRGQGAFEYLLMLGGIVLVSVVVIIMMQSSVQATNAVVNESTSDYGNYVRGGVRDVLSTAPITHSSPSGCKYSNPPCQDHYDCNTTTNLCEPVGNATPNGCLYSNPNCPEGYYCKDVYCSLNRSAMASPVPSPSPLPSVLPSPSPSPSPFPVNGACGTANKNYVYSASSFGTDTFCSAGSINATPSFPAAGSVSSWKCIGSSGGSNATCSAYRFPTPVNGGCGTANKSYAYSVSSFGTDVFCSAGSINATPSFPVAGSVSSWKCIGSSGGSNATCSAYRFPAPVNGACGTANGHYSASIPTGTGLCSAGVASLVSGSGPWSWFCNGTGGGTNVSCATVAPTYTVVSFTTVGTSSWTVPAGVTSVDVYVLGGGGGGGNGYGGGGGYANNTFNYAVTPGTSISVVVGAGGANGQSSYGYSGANGGASSFGSITASGGKGASGAGGNGGSGGSASCPSCNASGGSNGSNGRGANPGTGGGVSTVPFLDTAHYAPLGGGGAGLSGRDGVASNVFGGNYGGGIGCCVDYCVGSNGVANTGGGGGGADGYLKIGGVGGSGIVIVRYAS